MLHKVTSLRDLGRKVSPPQPTYMTDEQKSQYLSNLRNNRPTRPGGSRPPPFKSSTYTATASHSRTETVNDEPTVPNDEAKGLDDTSNKRVSIVSFQSGRPLAQAPSASAPSVRGRKVSPTAVIQPSSQEMGVYHESGRRQLERQESHRLREALEKVDRLDDEKKIHSAAQSEAAELVWQHRNPKAAEAEKTAAYRNPDLGSVSRSKRGELVDALAHPQLAVKGGDGFAPASNSTHRRRSSGKRVASSGSSKGVFRNPEDQIYEEPEEVVAPVVEITAPVEEGPLRVRPRNSLPRGSRPLPQKADTMPALDTHTLNKFEIQRNPPSQSRNAAYTVNSANTPVQAQRPETRLLSEGIEVRGDDIRAATSMRKKDRSPKLPTPTAVSDRPGRPIVSFDKSWSPSNNSPRISAENSPVRPPVTIPAMAMSAPAIPTINLPDEPASSMPTVRLPDDDRTPAITVSIHNAVPTINLPEDDTIPAISVSAPPTVPAISIQDDTPMVPRPLPRHSQTSPAKLTTKKTSSRLPWLNPSSRGGVPTATCTNCALPISGRIVTASGAKESSAKAMFHPECFTCHHCSTSLECIAFYPEPDNKRLERLAAEGLDPDSPETELQFYCHLDFHDLFSPRCRSCKTPIEGEVIVAAGGEYHVGHFFCAECGDPFDSNTPFVEKDSYAYCVSCHTKRTSARCKACKRQILDEMTVEALGGKWHEECFNCFECGGGFGDDGRFFVRDVDVEATEKERRRGVRTKVEERAVCEACEGRRLKA